MIRRRRTFPSTVLVLFSGICLGACDDDPVASPDGAADAGENDAEAGGDVGPDSVGGSVRVDFDLTVDGRGGALVTGTRFAHSVGAVTVGRDIPALAYEITDWAAFGYVLYHVLAPRADDLHVLYLYCSYASARSLDWVWHESYGVAMDYEAGAGECFSERVPVVAEVSWDALSALPAPESIASGLVVAGPDAVLDDAGGFVMVEGREYRAHPFGLVDCTTECSADPLDGWWEIHTVLQDPLDDERCFGTVYLMVASPDAVEIDYGFCLESLTRLPDTALDASWRRTAKARDPAAVPAGPYDPRAGHVLRPGPRLFSRRPPTPGE